MKKALIFVGVGIIFKLVFSQLSLAQEQNQFVTIVNPVRISEYNKNPGQSIQSEYDVIRKNNLPATWLLTYDALNRYEVLSVVEKMDNNQELGIFLEITKKFAEDAEVTYHDTGYWHHANAVFLSGYTQEERIKLIDKVFGSFEEKFGYYPTSVGSWWTDSYSLSYMKEKYGITSNLGCSDQFSTDGYKIWGQPWMIPYYPNKFHAGVPATDKSVKLDVVSVLWATRDPLNGYYNSRYSTQDYLVAPFPMDFEYFKKLIGIYLFKQAENKFGQITIGLEADLGPTAYNGEYAKQVGYVKQLQDENNVQVFSMRSFAHWYREYFPELSPFHKLEAYDLSGTGSKAVWHQDSGYRLFYTIDAKTNEATVRDLRVYNQDLKEPYYISPNREYTLNIYIPSVFDEVSNPNDGLTLSAKTKPELWLEEYIKKPAKIFSGDGLVIKGFSSEAVHFFKQKKAILQLISGEGWQYFKKIDYFIPQSEMYALEYLSRQGAGRVLVYDNECLQCEYHTKYKPAAFANLRGYVKKYGGHGIVYNKSIFQATVREDAKKEFNRLGVKYVYLVKFESYIEKLPFSPGDLGVEKIFDNANAEIWKVK